MLKLLKHICSSLVLLSVCLAHTPIVAQSSQSEVRTFPTSCDGVCNGSAELLRFVTRPERIYTWASAVDGVHHPLDQAIISDLCPGKYRIRRVDITYDSIKSEPFEAPDLGVHMPLKRFEFNSLGKQELSLYVRFDREVNYINYYITARYSLDSGMTWHSSSQFHQDVRERKDKALEVSYMLPLPRSANEREQIIVEVYQRRPNEELSFPPIDIHWSELESKRYEEYIFEVSNQENLELRSTVSNEMAGGDGYINLEVHGGVPPYMIKWDDGSNALKRRGLSAGSYRVNVTDSRACEQSTTFEVMAKREQSEGLFALEALNEAEGMYVLRIENLYRQPMTMTFTDSLGVIVKNYEINPLYEDLKMNLDLSFLGSGSYTARLSTGLYSQEIQVLISATKLD